jgi:uncharacterized protein YodC (DUF2158 family)
MAKTALKIGDIVQLKSGGPKMTVTDLPKPFNEDYATSWFAGSKHEHGRFPEDALQPFVEGDKKSGDGKP